MRGRRIECETLDRLVAAVRSGQSRALVLYGEPGVGKTALLDYVAEHASGCVVAQASGVQSEMELAYAGLQQVCAPMFAQVERLPIPQRRALEVALGVGSGPAPDRFLVGVAVLSLLSEVAEQRPVICLVDDQQWLDRASTQVLAFVARRLQAESVGMVFAARKPVDDVAALPHLMVEGLGDEDAKALLDSVLPPPLDMRIRDRIVAETRGNPLALLELPRGLNSSQLAGGLAFGGSAPLSGRLVEAFQRRLQVLPDDTRLLMLVAAAEPVGEPLLVWRAAEWLGIPTSAATAAAEAGLLEIGTRVLFRHPLVRSAVYRSAPLSDRQDVHRALAEATDANSDPDRRAWHRAQAAPGPDEDVAAELERSAGRAQDRGGLAAAAAFLERAGMLTAEPARRAERLLTAAKTNRDAGAFDAALGLLVAVEAAPLDHLQAVELQHLRGQIAMMQRRGTDAARLLRDAAKRLESLDTTLARDTHLEALAAAIWAAGLGSPGGLAEVVEAARAVPPRPASTRAVDVLLNGLVSRWTDGYAAAAPSLARAVELFLSHELPTDSAGRWLWLMCATTAAEIAFELWDGESAEALAARVTEFARNTGALAHMQHTLNTLARLHLLAGEPTTAAQLIQEESVIAEVSGNPPLRSAEMIAAAWRGQQAHASELIETTLRGPTTTMADIAIYASAVLDNGLGRHGRARDAARRVFELDPLGAGPFLVLELAEAASRTGDTALVAAALDWVSERMRVTPTDWGLGIQALVHALLNDGEVAERSYRESIALLGRTGARIQLARVHLLYGEWLRRERRRIDARMQLRIALDMLETMGIEAFAQRARRELAATGETARKRTVETTLQLTAQEAQIARLARGGLSNPEIGARLFISPRTVKYHLSKVF
ncbi:helix-turn-helix transcriptional regulator, partial [Mycobacterium sp.]|uniref:helix-turn-helix transcriptional regulator n=1 Tax=Mycobacterium sp. TaxID=1785 RepID=UPI002D3A4A03